MSKVWRHEVSEDWLLARRDVLTASEIKTMLPEYKRMLKKPEGELSSGFFALCGAKLSTDTPETESVGSAARGHIMEPYAIVDWNINNLRCQYHHWDDLVIKRNGVGYSPDALDIPQVPQMDYELWYDDRNKVLYDNNNGMAFEVPQRALEVKCYEPKAHMKNLIVPKEDKEERLQIATAFMVLPSLKHVDILWYCPEAPVPMYKERYKKSELKPEIDVITDMVKMFHRHMKEIRSIAGNGMAPTYTTDTIYDEYVSASRDSGFYSI